LITFIEKNLKKTIIFWDQKLYLKFNAGAEGLYRLVTLEIMELLKDYK
jgi:hypothetical protein